MSLFSVVTTMDWPAFAEPDTSDVWLGTPWAAIIMAGGFAKISGFPFGIFGAVAMMPVAVVMFLCGGLACIGDFLASPLPVLSRFTGRGLARSWYDGSLNNP